MNRLNQNKSNLSLHHLKGMQSVRATFTLPENIIALLSAVSTQLGLKQKSIFDHLVENKKTLDQAAAEAQKKTGKPHERRQKTYVLSRKTLVSLESAAKKYQLPRDILVECSIKHLLPVMDTEKQRHQNRKILLKELENFKEHAHHMVKRSEKLMGLEDENYLRLKHIFNQYDKYLEDLRTIIKKGKCLEKFDQI